MPAEAKNNNQQMLMLTWVILKLDTKTMDLNVPGTEKIVINEVNPDGTVDIGPPTPPWNLPPKRGSMTDCNGDSSDGGSDILPAEMVSAYR